MVRVGSAVWSKIDGPLSRVVTLCALQGIRLVPKWAVTFWVFWKRELHPARVFEWGANEPNGI